MINIHKLILDKLNEAYDKDSSIENAKKLATFVDTEIPNEVIKVLKERETVKTFASALILLCGGVIGVFFFILLEEVLTEKQALLFSAIMVAVLTIIFKAKFFNFQVKHLTPKKLGLFDLYCRAMNQIFEERKNKNDERLFKEYIDDINDRTNF